MQLIGLTKAVALTTLTFTLSATPTWSQTNQSEALSIKNSQVVSQRPPTLYSQGWSNRGLAVTYFNRGVDYARQQRWDLALFNYTQAIKLNPKYAEAYNNRGVVYVNQQKWNLALADYTQAIKLNPNFADAYYGRGVVYYNQQKWDLALADFNQAIRLNFIDAEAHNNRGLVYRKLGDINRAREDFQRAARLYSNQDDTAGYERAIRLLNSL
ncbi:tetratricopeptide repeat protein [Anabaenopsis arnoldii]|uniref:Tetratricopeptide repeat protein n=1 Tax=Anabaenopsis arnoldii TaxID=2152938 RepID=A0ABT5ARB3_9CYAN|nr:tetratricopeptide repeat protein [Anabaenopsis arnoldii]MDB9538986.1 tetratricopeptide repeat protein [Anabaenopsis arnoldii]MDH6091274.1 tetratricopeptide repeat protein [Anabaenopsis arnoldii]